MRTEAVMDHNMLVGRTLREARLSRHVKQSELARALNVTRSTVTRWESGTRPIAVSTLLTIAELLEIPASMLLPEHHRLSLAPNPSQVLPAHEVSIPDQAATRVVGQVLDVRPDLIPTVVALLETLVENDETMRVTPTPVIDDSELR